MTDLQASSKWDNPSRFKYNTNMAIYIIPTEYTSDMVNSVFSRLSAWEIKKRLGFVTETADACQTGYIECLIDLFGASSDAHVISVFESGKSWIHIVNEIIDTDEITQFIGSKPDMYHQDSYDQVTELSKNAVTNYLNEHFDKALFALKAL